MNLDLFVLISVLMFFHLLMDFFLQSHYIAVNKSKCNYILFQHVFLYTIGLSWFGLLYFNYNIEKTLIFSFFTFITHFCTDYITSRVNSYFWSKNRLHDFFCSVGVDQYIHLLTLLGSLYLINSF